MHRISLLVFALCITLSHQYCILNPRTNSTSASAFTSTTYCGDLVTYPVSDTTLANAATLHEEARTLYRTLRYKWGNRTDTLAQPDNDCLGVARQFFCASKFPACYGTTEQTGMCDFLCDLFSLRCSEETDTKNQLCATKVGSNCSHSMRLIASYTLLAIISITIAILI